MPSMREGVMLGIGLSVSFVVIAALFPTAIEDVAGTNTSNWSSLATTFWDLVQFGIPLAGFLFVIGWAMDVF